jgi:DNA repair protein RecN (Recombination protein N)
MLERLSVRGLGIIDAVELELQGGFVALTGETGAGKSLLVESLKLLGGQRAQSEMVRTGDDRLQLEGVFKVDPSSPLHVLLEELGIASDEAAVVLRRELSDGGRSRCWINDVAVTAGALQRAAPYLLAIHGQHEQHGLADAAVQRRLVDEFAGHDALVNATGERFAAWCEAGDRVERLRAAQTSRRDRLAAIDFQLAEIDAADPHPCEDEELRRRRLVLRHAARIAELSSALLQRLSEDETAVVDGLAKAERELGELAECGLPLAAAATRLSEARLQVEEVVRELQNVGDPGDGGTDDLESVESRLHLLEQLMLKHGGSLAELLERRERLLLERDELQSVEERLGEAEAAAAAALEEYDRAAAELDGARHSAGRELTAAVAEVLGRLAMGGTRLEFSWQPRADAASPLRRDGRAVAFDADGVDECELLLAANPGEELRQMARIASGGELSRVHLALRTVLRSRRAGGSLTLLFDEVDSGLGGATAAALAELLADLAAVDQVLVVTHLPQVAARADGHFRVEKVVARGRAVTRVAELSAAEREDEVARMLAGDELTESARNHARVLLGGA